MKTTRRFTSAVDVMQIRTRKKKKYQHQCSVLQAFCDQLENLEIPLSADIENLFERLQHDIFPREEGGVLTRALIREGQQHLETQLLSLRSAISVNSYSFEGDRRSHRLDLGEILIRRQIEGWALRSRRSCVVSKGFKGDFPQCPESAVLCNAFLKLVEERENLALGVAVEKECNYSLALVSSSRGSKPETSVLQEYDTAAALLQRALELFDECALRFGSEVEALPSRVAVWSNEVGHSYRGDS